LLYSETPEEELQAYIRGLRKKRNLIQRAERDLALGRLTVIEDEIKELLKNKEQILAGLVDAESLLWV
jgi:hypothetical protein